MTIGTVSLNTRLAGLLDGGKSVKGLVRSCDFNITASQALLCQTRGRVCGIANTQTSNTNRYIEYFGVHIFSIHLKRLLRSGISIGFLCNLIINNCGFYTVSKFLSTLTQSL